MSSAVALTTADDISSVFTLTTSTDILVVSCLIDTTTLNLLRSMYDRRCSFNCGGMNVWLLELYVLATSQVISGWVPTCDQCTLMLTYSAASLGDHAANTMT